MLEAHKGTALFIRVHRLHRRGSEGPDGRSVDSQIGYSKATDAHVVVFSSNTVGINSLQYVGESRLNKGGRK